MIRKFCYECAHYRSIGERCMHPDMEKWRDLVTGEYLTARCHRGFHGECGLSGKLWESKAEKDAAALAVLDKSAR